MPAEHLSEEVTVTYNEPRKFSRQAEEVIRQSLFTFFGEKPIRFYKNDSKGCFSVANSTVTSVFKKKSRFNF